MPRDVRRWGGWACLAASLFCSVAFAQSPGTVVDRVVAVVEGDLLTQSQLELETRLLLIQRGGVGAAEGELGESALASALELSIAQRVQNKEADRLNAFQVESSEVEASLQAFREKFATPADFDVFLRRNEVDVSTLAGLLSRNLRAEKILDSKVRLRAQVTEADVRQAFEAQRAAGALRGSYEEVRPLLREQIYRANYQRLARAELEALQRSAKVRRIAPYARGEVSPQ